MKDLPIHILLFAVVGLAIVTLNAVFAEQDDRSALRSLPRRFAWFFAGCGILAVVMLLLERVFASVS